MNEQFKLELERYRQKQQRCRHRKTAGVIFTDKSKALICLSCQAWVEKEIKEVEKK